MKLLGCAICICKAGFTCFTDISLAGAEWSIHNTRATALCTPEWLYFMLKLDQVSHAFHTRKGLLGSQETVVRALDMVSFHMENGTNLGVVGESGCGKSTLGRIITGLLIPSSGQVKLHGQPVELGQIQMIFQDPFSSLNPRLTVGYSIAEPLQDAEGKQEKTKEIMELVGLNPDYAKRFPHEFSGGQRQRIAIARALITRPALVVCDEAVSALDASVQAQVLNLLTDLREQLNLSYVFISHDLGVVAHMSTHIAVMYLGRIVEIGTRDEIIHQARHPYTQALLQAAPVRNPLQRRERHILQGELPSPLNPPQGCAFHPRCPFAMDICTQKRPEEKDLSQTHKMVCYLVDA